MANATFGRDAVLDQMRDAVLQTCAGRGRLVVVSGEAGIGKSTIAAAVAEQAETRGATVHWGRAWEFADAPAYFPVSTALRALALSPHDEIYRDQGGAFRLWESVALGLAEASREKPIVWLLEDLHAADILTLDLLTFLAQAIRGLKVLIVVTARALDPRLDDRANARLTRMARDGIDIRLEPLNRSAIGLVASSVCGGTLPPSIIARLAELTGGNPLFVVECARAFKSSGTFAALPASVRQVVVERHALLPLEARAVLGFGAVLGREFTAALVGKMMSFLPARVIDDVSPALKAGIVTELAPGRFAFSHVVVRDVIEGALPAEERARIHALAEAALATTDDSETVIVERARHALEAGAANALGLVRRAIAMLEREGAHDRAHAFCERLAKSDAARDFMAPDWLQHARIAMQAGYVSEGRRLCDRVLALARDAKDARTFGDAALLAGTVIRPAFVDATLVALLEEARTLVADSDLELACRIEARLAAAMQPHEDFEVPCAMARAAIARARGLPERAFVEVLDAGIAALLDFAPIDERLAACGELLQRATAIGDRPRILRAHSRLALDHLYVGDFEACGRDIDASLRIATEMGHPRYRWRALLLSSMRALAYGDAEESERAIVEVSELAALTDDPSLPLTLASHRLHRLMMLHLDDELRREMTTIASYAGATTFGTALHVGYRALFFAWLEDAAETKQLLATLGDHVQLFEREISMGAIVAPAYALGGTRAMQARLRDVLAAHPDRESVGGHVTLSYEGPVARSLALLEAALGETEAATKRLAAAIANADACGTKVWAARMEYELARILLANGRVEEGMGRALSAQARAETIGVPGLARRARALVPDAAESSKVREAPKVPTPAKLELRREGETWRLDWNERTARVRDSRGMQLLARLVERAGEEVHVLALAADEGAGLAESSAGIVIDERALRDYRERLRGIAEESAEAERDQDRGRTVKLAAERTALEAEIARATGLGGRSRQAGSATERARVNVQRRLKDALARVGEIDAPLGRFLERAVRTGTFCCFRP